MKKITMMNSIYLMVLVLVTASAENGPAENQIIMYKNRTSGSVTTMTTSAGKPINTEETATLNKRLLNNDFFLDSLTHLVRERIPPRIVHANGAGAFGYFEVTHDITKICKANLFSKVGKKTPVAIRFSPVLIERGGQDTSRDIRGFAIKFYTEDGIFDIPGFNSPMFTFKDPSLFPSHIRSQKNNPATNLHDVNMFWDAATTHPEKMFIFLYSFGDRGIPNGYSHMPGFGVHTYQVINNRSENHFIRFHFMPDKGIKKLRSEEAAKIAAVDYDYNTRALYNAIGNGDFPSWTASIQVLSLLDVKNAGFDVFDVSKVLPLDKYPLRPFGRIVLNKNPVNYFAEIEQLIFNPGNLVPGILGGPDKLFEARRLVYRDAQNYRVGINHNKIPVNCPFQNKAFPYNRDGVPPVDDNMKDIPNYYPNSFNGPVPYKDKEKEELIEIHEDKANNFEDARELYINEWSPDERERAVENILVLLRPAANFLQGEVVKVFNLIHPDLGSKVLKGLQANTTTF